MPNFGFGIVYDEDDLEIVEELAAELGVTTFDFPASPESARTILNTDNKLEKKLDELAAGQDVTRFAVLIEAAMFVGATIPTRHIALLQSWLESDIKGDLHPDGQVVMLQASKIYQQGRPLNVPGFGHVILLNQGLAGTARSGEKAPECYVVDAQGNFTEASKEAYPEPAGDGKKIGYGRWSPGLWGSDLELDVLDDAQKKLGAEGFYWSLDDEEIRTKLEKDNALNKLLDQYAKGESIPNAAFARKKAANKFCFAVLVTLAISNGIEISEQNKRRIESYLESSKCGLDNQGWIDLRRALRDYRDGYYIPLQAEGLQSRQNSARAEERRYFMAKKQKAQK